MRRGQRIRASVLQEELTKERRRSRVQRKSFKEVHALRPRNHVSYEGQWTEYLSGVNRHITPLFRLSRRRIRPYPVEPQVAPKFAPHSPPIWRGGAYISLVPFVRPSHSQSLPRCIPCRLLELQGRVTCRPGFDSARGRLRLAVEARNRRRYVFPATYLVGRYTNRLLQVLHT
jgi:hypothetical protein